MPVEPIKPKTAQDAKITSIPDVVFECFNKLIAQNLTTGGSAHVRKIDVVSLIVSSSQLTANDLHNKKYLDIEYFYRKAGWKVGYESPDRGENYEPYYTFSSPDASAYRNQD